jgi:hypothetical protein
MRQLHVAGEWMFVDYAAYRLELDGPSMRKLQANEQVNSEARTVAKDVAWSTSAPLPKSAKGNPR